MKERFNKTNGRTVLWSRGTEYCAIAAALVIGFSSLTARGSIAYGSINNFDTVNDTGGECHGFEIELEDVHSTDVTYTYDWNHYGTPTITEDNSNPLHPRVTVRYAAVFANGRWSAYTAIPAGPILPTDGHQFTNPSTNFGGEHFGVGYRTVPSAIRYNWLVDNGSGTLVKGPAVNVATPTFNYLPPLGGVPPQVQAVIEPPPAPEVHALEFGPASWVKEIRTTTHNNREVKLRDLVSVDPDDHDRKDWRNGEPDEVEVEWQLLQTDFRKVDGGNNGALVAAPEDLDNGDEVVTRRYEFYKYVGPIDEETGEAMTDRVGPDDIHGTDDYADTVIVGEFVGSQMSAVAVEAPIGLVDHLPDGEVDTPYTPRTVVIAGNAPFTASIAGDLPDGMTFNPLTGTIAGTPTVSGVFSFTIEASDPNNPVISKSYTIAVAEPGEVLPPHSTVETAAFPANGGTVAGHGFCLNGDRVITTATPAPGFAFVKWTENGSTVSRTPQYSFDVNANRSLTAVFAPSPALVLAERQASALVFTWPTNWTGFVLQENTNVNGTNWTFSTNAVTVTGSNRQIRLSTQGGSRFYRLVKP